MKVGRFLLVLAGFLVVASLVGCATIETTNFPSFNSTTITIVNNTKSMMMDVILDGKIEKKSLPSGGHYTMTLNNWSDKTFYVSVVIKAWKRGKLVGSASRQFYVDGNYRRSETWIVDKSTVGYYDYNDPDEK